MFNQPLMANGLHNSNFKHNSKSHEEIIVQLLSCKTNFVERLTA